MSVQSEKRLGERICECQVMSDLRQTSAICKVNGSSSRMDDLLTNFLDGKVEESFVQIRCCRDGF